MFTKATAIVLAIVLLWAGFATHERPVFQASPEAAAASAVPADLAPPGVDQGSVDDHHLDDQPSQAQIETLADLPGAIAAHHLVPAPSLVAVLLAPYTVRAQHPPWLDGLQRPPRPTSIVA